MRTGEDERRLMALVKQIINWDKADANIILPLINEFEELILKYNYQPNDFGLPLEKIPTAYMPKSLKESGLVLLTDKNKSCIFGNKAPYKVMPTEAVKRNLKLIKKISSLE
jgi:hypothetical protein